MNAMVIRKDQKKGQLLRRAGDEWYVHHVEYLVGSMPNELVHNYLVIAKDLNHRAPLDVCAF